jgi:hypothetical protein
MAGVLEGEAGEALELAAVDPGRLQSRRDADARLDLAQPAQEPFARLVLDTDDLAMRTNFSARSRG